MTKQQKHLYGVELTNGQRLEVAELLQELKDAGLLMDTENMGLFMTHCFYRGLMEYKKDLAINDWFNPTPEGCFWSVRCLRQESYHLRHVE